jgi:hypothetical protein
VRRAAVLLLVLGSLAGCSPASLAWQEAALPALPAQGAIMLRDAAWCGDSWLVVGALKDTAGGTRPAAWTSTDGTTWTAGRMVPKTFYGEQDVMSAVACRSSSAAAVGGKSGGMHGNPRISSWRLDGGAWTEVPGEFELFGGNDAVNVGRIAAGPQGFLITGNRTSGAAVWRSPDAAGFTLTQGVPGLASDATGSTWAYDGAADPGGGWLVVGAVRPGGPLGWRSPDGKVWSRVPAAGPGEMQRIAGSLSAGVVTGDRFQAWRLDRGSWRPAGSFGSVHPGGVAAVSSLTFAAGRYFALVCDGAGYGLWTSGDGAEWTTSDLPAQWPARSDTTVTMAADGSRLVLIADDGNTARVFTAPA